jgi:hypothetical protein
MQECLKAGEWINERIGSWEVKEVWGEVYDAESEGTCVPLILFWHVLTDINIAYGDIDRCTLDA